MIEYSDRLRLAMEAKQMSPAELAKALGISYQGVKRVLDGLSKTFSAANNAHAARVLGINSHWLATGQGQMDGDPLAGEIDLDAHPDLVPIRRVQLRLQAGVSGFAVENDEIEGPPIFFRTSWLADRGYKPYNLVALKVSGPSMETTLFAEDMVVVNTADTEARDGVVFAVNYEGEAVIKRLIRDNGAWWLVSDNPDQRRFPRKECVEGSCIIVGKVIQRMSEQI